MRWLCLLLAACSFDSAALPELDGGPCVPTGPEECNGKDDDCMGGIDNGFNVGMACDGPDLDQCLDDTMVCTSLSNSSCSTGQDNVELCNNIDDDCDGAMDETFPVGDPCDGTGDGDLCMDGTLECAGSGTTTVCNDIGPDINVLGDDINNCGACDQMCVNPNGTTSCSGGTCIPMCAASTDAVGPAAQDCDGNPINGCELLRNTNPACAAAEVLTLSGDTNVDRSRTGSGEAWFLVNVEENRTGAGEVENLEVVFTLDSGSNDFDIYLYCLTCPGPAAVGWSIYSAGNVDSTAITKNDTAGLDTFVVLVEVRYEEAFTCSSWSLNMDGDPGSLPSNDSTIRVIGSCN